MAEPVPSLPSYEDPRALLRRLRLGREEFCQRLGTTLMVGGTYPRWNSRNGLTEDGVAFLRELHTLSFGPPSPADEQGWAAGATFVDEFELAARTDDEKSGWPDWALLFPDRIWLIELKTEKGSHRAAQLPYYLDLAAHHYPGRRVDLTYLTGSLSVPAPPLVGGARYAHLTWADVVPLADRVWAGAEPAQRAYIEALTDATMHLSSPWGTWRQEFAGTPVTAASPVSDADLLALATATASDGVQRALNSSANSPEELHGLRSRVEALAVSAPAGDPLRHVMAWVWNGTARSSGQPLTAHGGEQGYELRFSRYQNPVHP